MQLLPHLYNYRVNVFGINQICSVFFPILQNEETADL